MADFGISQRRIAATPFLVSLEGASGSPLQYSINSTCGLDLVSALEFVRTYVWDGVHGLYRGGRHLLAGFSGHLRRTSSAYSPWSNLTALQVFDEVAVLYKGRPIYCDPCNAAKDFSPG